MTKKLSLGALLAAAVLLAGCKGFFDALPSTGSGGGTGGNASGVFYVLNQRTGQIAGYSFATGGQSLTAVSNSPYTLGVAPLAMTISPNGSFLYVSTTAGISLYDIGSGGALTSVGVISTDQAFAMQVDSTGTWLVEAVAGVATLNAIPLTSTGQFNTALQEQTTTLPSANVQQLALTPSAVSSSISASFVFVAMGSGGTAVIPFTPTNSNPFGSVSRIAPRSNAGGDTAVAVDVSNPLLYIGETAAVSGTQTGGLRVFQLTATRLTEITGSPYATGGTGPSAILSTSGYVYVANKAVGGSTAGNITGYAVTLSGNTYSLAKVSTVNAGTGPVGLAEDSTSTYVLAVNLSGNPDLSTYTFDATTAGQLDAGITAATGTDPVQAVAVAAVP